MQGQKGKESIYHDAGRVLERLSDKKGSLKSLVFSLSCGIHTKKAIYALTSKSLQYSDPIKETIENYELLEKEPKLSYHVAFVIVYDLIFDKNFKAKGPSTRIILQHKTGLVETFEAVTKTSTEKSSSETSRLCPECILPRYVRVNTLKGTIPNVIDQLQSLGFTHTHVIEQVFANEMSFSSDDTIPSLLVFNPSSHAMQLLISSSLYQLSCIIFQDKSSCLPAHVLAPPPSSCIIDCCAAPGNKTSHLAALLNNTGKIYSFDRDKVRHDAMKTLLSNAGVQCVQTFNKDFLKVAPNDYPEVRYILVDPSCSGSGMHRRTEINSHKLPDKKRLKSLSRFQTKILDHALSFPGVHRVVYSTCSIHIQENESVVSEVLRHHQSSYELVDPLPQWKSRGLPSSPIGPLCIRVSPSTDRAQGFFLALFQRKL